MLKKFHPNSRSAWMLVALTVIMSAGVVALLHFSHSADGRILFTQFDGTDFEIFMMDTEGNVEQLTNNNVDDWGAGWSPDHSQIAFRSVRDGVTRIYVMDEDGSNVQAVSPTTLYAGDWGRAGIPAWSPNGDEIAFEAIDMTSYQTDFNIFVVNLRTGALEQITSHPGNDWHPDYSPDARKIAFAREDYNNDCYNGCDIYVMNADGSNTVRYTYSDGMDVFPQWSPDGSQILFHSERTGNSEVFVMNADGSQQSNVTNTLSLERVARWSEDGNSIIFRSERDGDSDIYVLNLRNGESTLKTDNKLEDRYPDW